MKSSYGSGGLAPIRTEDDRLGLQSTRNAWISLSLGGASSSTTLVADAIDSGLGVGVGVGVACFSSEGPVGSDATRADPQAGKATAKSPTSRVGGTTEDFIGFACTGSPQAATKRLEMSTQLSDRRATKPRRPFDRPLESAA